MYGTHYSAPAFAAYYLVRERPEWTLHLHGGKFDEADRSFFSLGETWAGVLRSTADVKELIPHLTPLSDPTPPSLVCRPERPPPSPTAFSPCRRRLASGCRLRARRTLVLGVPTHNVGVRRNRCLDCHRKSARRGSEQLAGQQPSSTVACQPNRRTGNPRRAAPLATVAAPTPPSH